MNDFFEELFRGRSGKNNIRPTRGQLKIGRNNAPLPQAVRNMLRAIQAHEANVFENKHLTNLFKGRSTQFAGRSGSAVGRAGLLIHYLEAVKTAMQTGRDAKKTRQEGRDQLFKNIRQRVGYVFPPDP